MPTIGEGTAPGCFDVVAGGNIGGGGAAAAPRRRRHRGDDRLALARDPHAHAAALELDFGEAGLVQELGELADHVMIDGRALGLVAGVFRRRVPRLAPPRRLN